MLRRVVWLSLTDVSYALTASIIMAMSKLRTKKSASAFLRSSYLSSWLWIQ
jgi:hypothetical protein